MSRDYLYKFEYLEVLYKCNKDNSKNCPFGSIFSTIGRECKYLKFNQYCDNKFMHAIEEGKLEERLGAYILNDKHDLLDTIQLDTKETLKG